MKMQKKRSGFCNRDPIFKITGRQRILENTLSTLYLLKGWINFNQNCIIYILGNAKEVIGLLDLVTLAPFSKSQEVKECWKHHPCLYRISWKDRLILTKHAHIYLWEDLYLSFKVTGSKTFEKKCFVFTLFPEEFDDLDLILKVVGGQKILKFPRFHHVSRRDWSRSNIDMCIIWR